MEPTPLPFAILDAPATRLGEGLRYDADDGALTWTDIPGDRAYAMTNGRISMKSPGKGPAFAIRTESGARIDILARGLLSENGVLVPPPGLGDEEALNDGSVHPSGQALILGSLHARETAPVGQVWLFDGTWVNLGWPMVCFNGGSFSPDGHWLYFTDSLTRTIRRAAVDPDTLRPGAHEVFATVPEHLGFPDGMVCDLEGFLWSAHWDGGCISRYDHDGNVVRRISLPAHRLTSLSFHGPRLDRLAVTSALADPPGTDGDLGGAVFVLDAGATGAASARLSDRTAERLFGKELIDVQTLP
jgi:sugar lactone lactonase YvrE